MKKLLLFIVFSLATTGAFAQLNSGCVQLPAVTTTGYIRLFPTSAQNALAVDVMYSTSGSPSSVAATVYAGDFPQGTGTLTSMSSPMSGTSGGDSGLMLGIYNYWYLDVSTFSGGSSPTLTAVVCYTKQAIAQSNANFALAASGAGEVRSYCTGVVGSAETEYLNGVACSGATTATARQVMAATGTLSNLEVFSSAAVVGGSGKDVLTVYKNGSATALTCTIAASGTACADTTHTVSVNPGDAITFQFVTATSDTAANVSAAFQKH